MTTDRSTEEAAMPAILVAGLHKSFGENHVLRGIDFRVAEGEVVCVIGPSGSGKSTLLRCVNRLEEPSEGSILIEGEDILDPDADTDALRSRIGMVFQSFNLFPHLSVLGNLTIAQRRVRRRTEAEAAAVARITWSVSGCSTRSMRSLPTSRVGSSSGSRSRGRSRWSRT